MPYTKKEDAAYDQGFSHGIQIGRKEMIGKCKMGLEVLSERMSSIEKKTCRDFAQVLFGVISK